MSSIPEKQPPHSLDLHEGAAPPEARGPWFGLFFLVFVLVMAVLFAVYILAWNGGGNT
jgi:hypothetical protein